MHAYIHTNIHINKHTYKQTYIHTNIHTNIHAYIHTYSHACMHAYVQTYRHTHTHTHTCTHAHIPFGREEEEFEQFFLSLDRLIVPLPAPQHRQQHFTHVRVDLHTLGTQLHRHHRVGIVVAGFLPKYMCT